MFAGEDVKEQVNEVKEDTAKEVVKEAEVHMKMESKPQMSLIISKIQSGLHSQTIQGKGSLRNLYAKSSW